MIRVFVTIDFPKKVKSQFADLVDLLVEEGYPLTFEKEENFHLTLKFLGWCEEEKTEEISGAIKKAFLGIAPFWFRPTKIGYFLKESLILWVGAETQGPLPKLVNQLENELVKTGFAKEKRAFSPHITLARKRRAYPMQKWRRMAEEIEAKFHPKFSGFQVKQIVLLESTLTPQGSIYTPLVTFRLKARDKSA
ncbi:RNA 2',3'-cyclic phosphodiesterase [Candidatus Gottesmanbacteria bacterium]|nr:RNA 2',3'-cyclic phosphodiesterase [Candidatus Gottesmanbacteria bacterium]